MHTFAVRCLCLPKHCNCMTFQSLAFQNQPTANTTSAAVQSSESSGPLPRFACALPHRSGRHRLLCTIGTLSPSHTTGTLCPGHTIDMVPPVHAAIVAG